MPANTAQSWCPWTVQWTASHQDLPFIFRLVDTSGTTDEQKRGGFLSASFHVHDDTANVNTLSSSPASPTPTRSSTTQAATPNFTQTTASSPVPSSTSNPPQDHLGLSVGLGVGLGVVIFAAAICLGFFLYRSRRKKKMEAVYSQPIHPPPAYHQDHPGERGAWEPPSSTPHEADSRHVNHKQTSIQELSS